MPLTLGDKLGPYEILDLVGKGGMGEVYRARDPRLEREVAIKVSAEPFSERFEREARAIASLNHPNICTLHDVGPDYLVMELVDGQTLADRIRRGPLTLEEALRVARQIADALEAAHEKGIVHRDLKPGNIKITADGLVKVLDFGLAKVNTPDATGDDSPTISTATTEPGIILGTAAYMAPEQALGKSVDKRADIWAFGAVLYEMLAGRRPFKGETATALLASVLKDEPDFLQVPSKAQPLLRRCLQKDPKQRLRDIADAWPLLEMAETRADERRRRPWLTWLSWVATTMVLTGFLALAAIHFFATTPDTPEARLQIPVPEGLTFNDGTQATISPDGQSLAFAAMSDGLMGMYIRSLKSLEVKRVPGSEVVPLSAPPFWSADSQSIFFSSGWKLKRADISGRAPPQDVCEMSTETLQGSSMNRDGVIIFAGVGTPLSRTTSSSGPPCVPLTSLASGELAHRWPEFLPDNRHFLYHRAANSLEKTGIYVGSIDLKPEQQSTKILLVTDRWAHYVPSSSGGDGWLLFMQGDTVLARPFSPETLALSGESTPIAKPVGSFSAASAGLFSVSTTGVLVYRSGGSGSAFLQLTWFDSQGHPEGTAGDPQLTANDLPPLIDRLALSPDGRRVAYATTGTDGNNDIAILDVVKANRLRLTFDPRRDAFPVWSSDGNKVAFASDRTGHLNLYAHNSDGSGADQLLYESNQNKVPDSWHGDFLLFESRDPKTSDDLWTLRLSDGKAYPFLCSEASETDGEFSPDGKWVAYVSQDSGTPEVLIRPFSESQNECSSNAGSRWQVSIGGGSLPRWRGDSKQLFYFNLVGQLMVVDVNTEKTVQILNRRQAFNSRAYVARSSYGIAGNGSRFLFLALPSKASTTPMTVLLNWRENLNR